MANFPISLSSVVNLAEPAYEIPDKFFRSVSTTIEGDKNVSVCVKKSTGPCQVVIVNLATSNHTSRTLPEKADAALMHPTENILSYRGREGNGTFIQSINVDSETKVAEHNFAEEVVFWKWVSSKILAIVTKSAVWHWALFDGASPEKVFPRSGRLASSSVQIINYCVDADVKWCLLTGISTQDNRTIDGSMQLYSVERGKDQLIDGHAGCFCNLVIDESRGPTPVFAFAEKTASNPPRLHVRDIYAPRGEGFKLLTDIAYPAEAATDFPVSMTISQQYGVVYVITKGGLLFMFDAVSGTNILTHKISADPIFMCSANSKNGGFLAVNKKGLVLTGTVNEQIIVSYMQNNLRHIPNSSELALSLARRYGLPGADEQLMLAFNNNFASRNYQAAARIAASMKSGLLRTPQTIEKFKSVPKTGDQPSAILQYFSTLLEYGKLNAVESIEICRPVVAQGHKEFVEKWLVEDKLECTEALGDIIKQLDSKLALKVYQRADVPQKVVHCLVEQGQYDQIVAYSRRTGYQSDYSFILRSMAAVNPEAAANFAKQLLESDPPLVDVNVVVDIFAQQSRFQEVTSILLEFLKGNKREQGYLQTRLLEINLINAPTVAEAIFQMDLFSHYDRKSIAQLCEKAGLFQRALEHYNDAADMRRVIARTGGQLNLEWLSTYLGKLSPDAAVECLRDMLRANRQNLQTAVQMAIKYYERIGAGTLIEMFESFDSWEGIFCFLGSILAFSSDPEVHFKYIEAAAKLKHFHEVERVCRESKCYDAARVKEFLEKAKLEDPRPLIYVCDMHGFEGELAEYLYTNGLMKFIEVYVTRVNTAKAPVVIGRLVDLDCSEDFIQNLLQSVRDVPTQPLVDELERRNRLRLLLPWLEARVADGKQEAELHNALAKINIDMNRQPEHFLENNAYYDSKVVGHYCEKSDPHMAYVAYKRGKCDQELVDLTNKNNLFRLQARYLVERQNQELWAVVLNPENEFRRSVIEQVVSTALPESSEPEEVSVTVKAFIQANLPEDLIDLLEKIVLHNSDFSTNKNLQNLLLLTAMKADRSKMMDYINRLEHYEGREIAEIALKDEYKLYEEAFQIYKKFNLDVEAIDVLINYIDSVERSSEFAARRNEPVVWSKLANFQLRKGLVTEAIDSYLKAGDAEDYREVTEVAERAGKNADLVRYLQMARGKVKDQHVDTELTYGLAKCNKLQEMKDFVEGTNMANVQAVGDRLFNEEAYTAAKILFLSIPNHARLASCHVKLREFSQAVDAAKKANSPKTWKEVNLACVSAHEQQCAHTAGLHIIVHPDHLDDLIAHYERNGLPDALIALLEAGVDAQNAHAGLFTELGILYAKYNPSKLTEFIRSVNVSANRLNIPKLIRACERHQLWNDVVYLHITYDEYDQAANTMIAHSAVAWNHETFCKVMQKISNIELFYRAISFYLDEHPLQLNSLLTSVASKVDHTHVVQQLKKAGHIALVLPYLQQIQELNILAVNQAVNELLLEASDYEALRRSISDFDNFDQLALAERLESHELFEMRRLAALLYKKNRQFSQAIDLSKKDNHFQDAMETARDSGEPKLVEDLLRFFASSKNRACFAACLYVCCDLVPTHVALELAWRCNFTDQVMPFMTQKIFEYSTRLEALERKLAEQEESAKKEKSAPNDFVPGGGYGVIRPEFGLMGNLALPMAPQQGMPQAAPQPFPPQGGGSMGMMGMRPSGF